MARLLNSATLISKITFFEAANGKDLILNSIHNVKVSETWEELTDTASIEIAGRLSLNGQSITVGDSGFFKVGGKVKIELGYKPDFNTEFIGYISAVDPKSVSMLTLEDSAWLLKQNNINASYQSINIQDLIPDLLSKAGITGMQTNLIDANIGNLRVKNANVAQVLEQIRKDNGLVSYFRDEVLYVGFAYPDAPGQTKGFGFQETIINDSLDYKEDTDVKVKVKAISVTPDNKRITYEAGDANGDQKTLYYYDVSLEDLKKFADNDLSKFRYTGYFGEFKTFGIPYVRHGDAAYVRDFKFPERDGTYFIDKTVTEFGTKSGYKRTIKLGPKVNQDG